MAFDTKEIIHVTLIIIFIIILIVYGLIYGSLTIHTGKLVNDLYNGSNNKSNLCKAFAYQFVNSPTEIPFSRVDVNTTYINAYDALITTNRRMDKDNPITEQYEKELARITQLFLTYIEYLNLTPDAEREKNTPVLTEFGRTNNWKKADLYAANDFSVDNTVYIAKIITDFSIDNLSIPNLAFYFFVDKVDIKIKETTTSTTDTTTNTDTNTDITSIVQFSGNVEKYKAQYIKGCYILIDDIKKYFIKDCDTISVLGNKYKRNMLFMSVFMLIFSVMSIIIYLIIVETR